MNNNFCERNQYKDALGIFNESISHEASMLKMRVRVDYHTDQFGRPESYLDNLKFGIREVLLIMGDCSSVDKNCLTCNSNQCFTCKSPYVVEQSYNSEEDRYETSCVCDIAGSGQMTRLDQEENYCIEKC